MEKTNLFDLIKQRVSILDVIGQHVVLKKAGNYWKGKCPFHDEKTGSFTVSPHRDIFYCFGCHEGGDVIAFTEKIEKCSPIEAAKHLADRYNIPLPETIGIPAENNSDAKKRYFDLCKTVAYWCHGQLYKYPSVKDYITQRGFTEESIKQFSIGYFPGGPKAFKELSTLVSQHNFLIKDLLDAHIIEESKASFYSPFEQRIIFPIQDHLGRFCGFGGRIFKKDDERSKYYNSRENNYFQKGSLLFGLDQAKKEIQKTGSVFLVEGYTDCIAMVQHGIINTVATLGTACTHEHLKALSYHAQQLYVVYDGDTAGQNAMLRLTELCWNVDLDLKVIHLPEGDDPASFIMARKDFKHLVEQAQDIFSFFLHAKGHDFKEQSLSRKLDIMRQFLGIIKKLPDQLKQDLLLEQASSLFNVSILSLKQEMTRLHVPVEKTAHIDVPTNSNALFFLLTPLEKRLVHAILSDWNLIIKPELVQLIHYMPGYMQELLEKLKDASIDMDGKSVSFSHLFKILTDEEKKVVSELILDNDKKGEHEKDTLCNDEDYGGLLLLLEKHYWKAIVQNVKIKISQAQKDNDTQMVNDLVNSFLQLKQKLLGKGLL